MDIYVARQPIFDRDQNVYAYELLYRQGSDTASSGQFDGDKATSEVIVNSFLLIGIEELTQKKPAFINFTENLLKQEIPTVFPKELIVVELLEDIEPTDEVIHICKKLKNLGYQIALDDFVYDPKFQPLLPLADIIKVDFLATSPEQRKSILQLPGAEKAKFLAEKVETREEFEDAVKWGYSYFQGYFFSKPVILSGKDIPRHNPNMIQVLEEMNQPEPNIDKIAKWIECDVSLSYKLLRLVNSAAYQVRRRITSVKQAIMLLGLQEIRKWACLALLQETGKAKPEIIIKDSMVKAKFGELLAPMTGLKKRSSEIFLMGLFSRIDVLMNCTLSEALRELPISDDIKHCLMGGDSDLSHLYFLMSSYEKGEWEECRFYANALGLNDMEVVPLYLQSIKWVNALFAEHWREVS